MQPQINTHNDHLLTGTSHCGCRGCGEVFCSERAFEAHRLGEHRTGRHCMTRDQLPDGFEPDPKGRWRLPIDAAEKARLRNLGQE